MAKKRKSNKPNIPKATLERARKQAEGIDVDAEAEAQARAAQAEEAAEAEAEAAEAIEEQEAAHSAAHSAAHEPAPVSPATTGDRAERAARRAARRARASSGRGALRASTTGIKRERKDEKTLDHDAIRERLAHPTKPITEEDLRRDYMYVLKDLQSMFLLSAVLIVVIVLLGNFI